MAIFFDLIRKDAYIPLNKQLAKLLGNDTAILYCELASRYYYFETKNQLTKDGMFFNTVEDLGEETNLSEKVQKKCVDKLVKAGLLEVKKFGLPCRRYFKMNTNDIEILQIIERLKLENEKYKKGLKPPFSKNKTSRKGLKSQYLPNGGTSTLPIDCTSTLPIDGTNTCQMAVDNNHNVITKSNNQNIIISSEKKLKNSASKKTSKKTNEEKIARDTRYRELKNIFMTEIWERYPAQHRVGEKICFSKFKKAVNEGVAIEEILDGFNQYLKIIEINQYKNTKQYIKRLDNWFSSESWKNPNRLMVSQYDKKMQHQMNSKYPSQNYCGMPPVFQQSMYNEPRIDINHASEEWLEMECENEY